MRQSWGPTWPGKLFTSTKPWSLSLDRDQFVLEIDGRRHAGSVLSLDGLTITRGVFWSTVRVADVNGKSLVLDGMPNTGAQRMHGALNASIAVVRHQQLLAKQISDFAPELAKVRAWVAQTKHACSQHLQSHGWLSRDFRAKVIAAKPQGLDELLAVPEVQPHLTCQAEDVRADVSLWQQPFPELADSINKRHLERELVNSRQFFNTVEKDPLTREQAEAVICFDNRVLLVASAGSGKTSTMVAKAGYALKQKYFEPDRILLLAFNSDAAAELRERIKARLVPLGLPADRVVAKTFHAFGLDVIGSATGKKPSLAPWVETGRDQEALLKMVDDLKDSDPQFRSSWDMFRLVFGEDLPQFGKEGENPDAWDRESGRKGFRTLGSQVVKSRGELVIANWLFYNGVEYVYEAAYQVDTADATHRQYRPDFYIPAADAYLEHWALDAAGEPPPSFTGYKEGMVWKRGVHAANKTTLLETTMADLWSGKAFTYLERELRKRGVELNPNPGRHVPGRRPIENPRLARTIRSFLTHAKSNRLTITELRKRLDAGIAGEFRFRHEMFLSIFEKLWNRWEARLKADDCIDFEDMLNQAADCIEQERWASPYELVMVDEFQDASQARARLVAGLVKDTGRHLFAVGDDWQSINRFAGADLGVMTDFEAKFGKAVTLKLETTFRCSQVLCDVSSQFVQKNPKQLKKAVRSPRNDVTRPVRIVAVRDEDQIRAAIEARVAELAAAHPGRGRPTTVFVLGRYRHDEAYRPSSIDTAKVQVKFMTVHSSKGLEADHVILPRVTSETLGFPSRVANDPVLQLAMPGGDGFEFSEERRLFYVALTRAKQTVTLVTVARKESPFVTELVRDFDLKVLNADGSENRDEICPKCGAGFLVAMTGRHGPFFGCTNFPRCDHKRTAQSYNRSSGGQGRPRR
jgi:DNA helicase-4